MGVNSLNVSDSIQGRNTLNPYLQSKQNVRNDGKPASKTTTESTDHESKLDALKSRMQSGESVNLSSLADSMLKKGAFIDVQA